MPAAENDQIYETNIAAIRDRWPLLAAKVDQADLDRYQFELTLGNTATVSVDGIQLTSRHDPVAEAEIQAEATPVGEALYLYGFGLGFLADHLIKTRCELKRLEIKITNAAIFKFVISILDISGITKHPKVNISMACEDIELLIPFFAHPESLTLCDDDTLKMRDRINHAVRIEYINSQFTADNELLERIKNFNFHKNRRTKAVSSLFNMSCPGQACIIGAGPSLEDNIDKLKSIINNNKNSIVIACDTAVVALHHHGINPNIVVTIDKGINNGHFKSFDTKTSSLVFMPTTSHNLINLWKGPKYYFITSSFLFEKFKKTEAINTLISNGSVIHPAIDLGVAMGYKEIILFGADFAFIKNKTHAYWKSGELWGDPKSKYLLFNGKGEKVPSTPSLSAYLFSTEFIIKNYKNVKFYNTSLEGALIAGTTQFQANLDD